MLSLPAAEPRLVAHLTFWSASAVLLVGSYVLTTAPTDASTSRYAIPVLYGTAALLPLALLRQRLLLVAGATVIALASLAGLLRKDYADVPVAGGQAAAALERVVRAEHLDHGFAG